MSARLYLNLGNYMGNNYESAVITAREAMKIYPPIQNIWRSIRSPSLGPVTSMLSAVHLKRSLNVTVWLLMSFQLYKHIPGREVHQRGGRVLPRSSKKRLKCCPQHDIHVSILLQATTPCSQHSRQQKQLIYIIIMDYRKIAASSNTETRDVMKLAETVGNVYEMVMIISKRANQLSIEMKQDLDAKLQEFASYTDNLEEVFEIMSR